MLLQVLFNQDEGLESAPGSSGILRPPEEKELNRIKPNPNLKLQPIFIDPGPDPKRKPDVLKASSNRVLGGGGGGMSLEITGRVQHDDNELKHLIIENQSASMAGGNEKPWRVPLVSRGSVPAEETECY